eukprot:gene9044-biopygen4677
MARPRRLLRRRPWDLGAGTVRCVFLVSGLRYPRDQYTPSPTGGGGSGGGVAAARHIFGAQCRMRNGTWNFETAAVRRSLPRHPFRTGGGRPNCLRALRRLQRHGALPQAPKVRRLKGSEGSSDAGCGAGGTGCSVWGAHHMMYADVRSCAISLPSPPKGGFLPSCAPFNGTTQGACDAASRSSYQRRSRMSDPGCQIQDVRSRMSDPGCQIQDVRSRMSDPVLEPGCPAD